MRSADSLASYQQQLAYMLSPMQSKIPLLQPLPQGYEILTRMLD